MSRDFNNQTKNAHTKLLNALHALDAGAVRAILSASPAAGTTMLEFRTTPLEVLLKRSSRNTVEQTTLCFQALIEADTNPGGFPIINRSSWKKLVGAGIPEIIDFAAGLDLIPPDKTLFHVANERARSLNGPDLDYPLLEMFNALARARVPLFDDEDSDDRKMIVDKIAWNHLMLPRKLHPDVFPVLDFCIAMGATVSSQACLRAFSGGNMEATHMLVSHCIESPEAILNDYGGQKRAKFEAIIMENRTKEPDANEQKAKPMRL